MRKVKSSNKKKKRRIRAVDEPRRGVYILPNFLTSLGLFFGFFSIISSIKGEYHKAAIAIFLAAVFDGMDGRVARLTRSVSGFGVQYDSLADLISFGVAPALLAYLWVLQPYGRWGWLGAFLYVACAALRLARFNLQYSTVEKSSFRGLPTPGAAGIIASTVLIFRDLGVTPGPWLHIALIVLMYVISFVMISNIPFPSFKDLGLLKRKPFISMFFVVLVIVLISAEPAKALFGFAYAYFLSGLVGGIMALVRRPVSEESKVPAPEEVRPQ